MAKIYTTEMAKVSNGQKASGKVVGGRIRGITDSYTFSSAASGDNLVIGRLNKGDIVAGGSLYHAALGAGVTLTLQALLDDGTTVSLTTAISSASAGTDNLFDGTLPYEMADDGEIVLTVGGGTANGDVAINVLYQNG